MKIGNRSRRSTVFEQSWFVTANIAKKWCGPLTNRSAGVGRGATQERGGVGAR